MTPTLPSGQHGNHDTQERNPNCAPLPRVTATQRKLKPSPGEAEYAIDDQSDDPSDSD